eukprot:m.15248 g.15248  ORF g.15248 m.15248 type:complete len:781 (-) comp8612_c0_seq1:81-2423(-)
MSTFHVGLILLMAVCSFAAPPATLDDLDVLRDRLIDFYIHLGDCTQTQFCIQGGYMLPIEGGSCANTCQPSQASATSLQSNGLWKDVNYTNTDHAVWAPTLHLERTLAMARAWRCPLCPPQHSNTHLLGQIHSALGGWLSLNITGPQWWWQDIGTPEYLGAIATLLNDTLTNAERAGVVAVMENAGDGTKMDGMNMLWEQQVAMNRELLLRNPENVAAIFDLLWSHIAITTGDGIQADGSFHFHGNQLYSGGYGADEAVQLATICQLTSGLAGFAPPPAAFDIVSLYLLNGTQYILRTGPNGTFFDLSTKGREITRAPDGNLAFPSAVFIQALNSTIFLDSAHGAEYKALLDQVAGIGRPFVGARHFYRSDYTTVHRPAFFASLKMGSTRMVANEICNGEGLLSGHTADGVLLVYQTGTEYLGIFPVWDWNTLPGATSQPYSDLGAQDVHHVGASAFVGGCVENSAAALPAQAVTVSTMDYASNGAPAPATTNVLSALKSVMFLDDAVVAVGTNVTLTGSGDAVITTLDQRLLADDGAVYVQLVGGGSLTKLTRGNHTLDNVLWIHHADTVHLIIPLDGRVPKVQVRLGPQQGTWRSIDSDGATDTVTKDVFFAAIEHGSSPTLAVDGYGYTTIPGVSLATAGAAVVSFMSATTIVAQTDTVHAVLRQTAPTTASPDGWVLAAAVRRADARIDSKVTMMVVSSPCVLVVRNTAGALALSAASPAQLSGPLTVLVQHPSTATGFRVTSSEACTRINSTWISVAINLPSGALAGSTASVRCT